MQVDTTRLAVSSGHTVIPMLNGILALVSGKTLKFYSWINRFEPLAGVNIDADYFAKDSNITVTHDDKILVTRNELSLHVYTLRRGETKTTVSFRTLMQVDRSKEWIEKHMVSEPYYIGESKIAKKMLFYVDLGDSAIYAAVDVGIRVADYRFWSVFRNRIVVYDDKMRKLFYFALVGGAHTSSVTLRDGAEPRENTIVGNSTAIFCENCTYIFWNVDSTFDCIEVDSCTQIVLLGDKYAEIAVDSFAIYNSRKEQLQHSLPTLRLLHHSNVLAAWLPAPEQLSDRSDSSPASSCANSARSLGSARDPGSVRDPGSARAQTRVGGGITSLISQSHMCTTAMEKDSIAASVTPPQTTPARKRSPSISCEDTIVDDAEDACADVRGTINAGGISIPRLNITPTSARVKIAPVSSSTQSSARGHRRTPSGNPIRDALVKRNSRNAMLSSMGRLLMQDHATGDLIVGLMEKI